MAPIDQPTATTSLEVEPLDELGEVVGKLGGGQRRVGVDAAVAVAAQVDADDAEAVGQAVELGLEEAAVRAPAMHQEQGPAGALLAIGHAQIVAEDDRRHYGSFPLNPASRGAPARPTSIMSEIDTGET